MRAVLWATVSSLGFSTIFLHGCGSRNQDRQGDDLPPIENLSPTQPALPAESSTPPAVLPTIDQPFSTEATQPEHALPLAEAGPLESAPPVSDAPISDPQYDQVTEPNLASIQAHLVNPYCVPCHQSASDPGGLDLRDLTLFLSGGPMSRAGRLLIVPGKPEFSLIVRVVEDPSAPMPPALNILKIPAVKAAPLEALKTWIKGLPSPVDDNGSGLDPL